MAVKLVEAPGTVLAGSSSLWAVYAGAAVLLVDQLPAMLQSDIAAHLIPSPWREVLLAVALAAATICRVIKQERLRRATAAVAAEKAESTAKELSQ